MRNILFVCDFNSIHSRNLIGFFSKKKEFNITVLSSFSAPEMEGVKLHTLISGALGDKSALAGIAKIVSNLSPALYRRIVSFFLARRTKKLIGLAGKVELQDTPDIIHALRTQPEGIVANEIYKKFKAKFYLTTWGQDFVLFAKKNRWILKNSIATVKNTTMVFPDNYRDDRIIKEDFGFKEKKCLVLPATGGLDFQYLDNLKIPELKVEGDLNFFSMRGYDNSYVNLTVLLKTFLRISKKYPSAHFYIDLHKNIRQAEDANILKWLKRENLQDKVTLLHLSREEMFAYMSCCRFHVSATYSDGLPLSLIESLYFGQVPIVFNHESTRILASQFDHYFSFDAYAVSNLENKWLEAMQTSIPTQKEIKAKNRMVLESNYNRIQNLNKIGKYYV